MSININKKFTSRINNDKINIIIILERNIKIVALSFKG